MEITLTKNFYKPECLFAVTDEFKNQIEVKIQSETNDNFLIHFRSLIGDFENHRTIEKFLNRFLEISILKTFT